MAAGVVATACGGVQVDFALLDDLQKVDETVLAVAKGKMEETFEQNLVLSGDDGYEYDKRVEFGEAEEVTSWDE